MVTFGILCGGSCNKQIPAHYALANSETDTTQIMIPFHVVQKLNTLALGLGEPHFVFDPDLNATLNC